MRFCYSIRELALDAIGPAHDRQTEIDPRAYRRALARFTTGVAVVTARSSSGPPVGLTISSFSSVSLRPPLVLFSIDRASRSLERLMAADDCAVNVLSATQRSLSEQFSKPQTDKWCAVDLERGAGSAPLLTGALAHFECERYATYDGGDHVIFVVRVRRFKVQPGAPLVVFDGAYRSLPETPEA